MTNNSDVGHDASAGSPGGGPDVRLRAGGYALDLRRAGGAVTAFGWRGEPIFAAARGPGILDQACFPLVPFSNRIAFGAFRFGGLDVRLARNFPGSDHPHPLHGFGWLADWSVDAHDAASCILTHEGGGGEWPWRYRARQRFAIDEAGVSHTLSLTNLAASTMPAGLGMHPYLPRTGQTRLASRHSGEWQVDTDCLPQSLTRAATPRDYWAGMPVAGRAVDTTYVDRDGPIVVTWPERQLALSIEPSADLRDTVIYTPADADYFCVEPVTHATDAVNRDAMHPLPPGDTLTVAVRYRAFATDQAAAMR